MLVAFKTILLLKCFHYLDRLVFETDNRLFVHDIGIL